VERESAPRASTTDTLTVIAIAVMAFIVSNVLHEAVGHGGACLLVGGKPLSLTAVYFDNDPAGLGSVQTRLIAAGGPLINLLTGLAAWIVLRRSKGVAGTGRYFVWLLMTLGLFMGTGYLLFSGMSGIGDMAVVTEGLQPSWLWRIVLTATGGLLYFVSARIAVGAFSRIDGGEETERIRSAGHLALISYLAGGATVCLAGLLNPQGFIFVLISAASSTLGGASGLLWMMQLMRGPRFSSAGVPPLVLPRSWSWIVASGVVLLAYVFVLGPGIRF
jgi:hypothetical protein